MALEKCAHLHKHAKDTKLWKYLEITDVLEDEWIAD